MNTIYGESGRYLDINLTTKTFTIFKVEDEILNQYLGGKGLGLKLIYDRLGGEDGSGLADVDPLGEENILAFMMGAFLGTKAPCSARFAGVTKSPLTGIMVASSCGGPFGMACRTAGWDGLLVSGKAQSPTTVRIDENGVTFEDASAYWGQETTPTQNILVDNPKKGALVIGPAGENGVLYSVIRSGHRYLGRGGMGTVMGAKNLKAIVAVGRAYKIEPADPELFKKVKDLSKNYINGNSFIKNYRSYGTNAGVLPGMKTGFAPVRNFKNRTDPRLPALSGEAMAEKYQTKHSVCAACAVLCGKKGTYPDGEVRQIPEYETIGLFGGNIMNFDPDPIGVWNDQMGELGMDTISAGATIGWAMEAAEKGLRKSELKFGKTDNISKVLNDIGYCRGPEAELGLGVRKLSKTYGGEDFAPHVKGMEMAAYDPRAGWGQGLNYAVANRGGCHLNAYPIALEALFGFLPPYTTISKAQWVDYNENLFSVVNSIQTCQFTVYGYMLEPLIPKYTPKPILKTAMFLMPRLAQSLLDLSALSRFMTAITGRKITERKMLQAGRRIHVLERHMNCLMGIRRADDSLPGRFLNEADTMHPDKKAVNLEPMLKQYYRCKGYDSNGLPAKRTLKKLGISGPQPQVKEKE